MKDMLNEYYLVEFRDGYRGMVVIGTGRELVIVTENEEWLEIDDYDDNLLIKKDYIEGYNGDTTIDFCDIMKIYGKSRVPHKILSFKHPEDYRYLIWQRLPIKKMTKKQIEEKLGYKIEIVEE